MQKDSETLLSNYFIMQRTDLWSSQVKWLAQDNTAQVWPKKHQNSGLLIPSPITFCRSWPAAQTILPFWFPHNTIPWAANSIVHNSNWPKPHVGFIGSCSQKVKIEGWLQTYYHDISRAKLQFFSPLFQLCPYHGSLLRTRNSYCSAQPHTSKLQLSQGRESLCKPKDWDSIWWDGCGPCHVPTFTKSLWWERKTWHAVTSSV